MHCLQVRTICFYRIDFLKKKKTIFLACQTDSTDHPMHYYCQSSNRYEEYFSNHSQNTQLSANNYCSCCTPSTPSTLSMHETIIATNPNQSLQINSQYAQAEHEDFVQITSITILTTKSYSNSSFISFLINSFSNFSHHSIIYIDDPTTFLPNHPSISNVYYFICLDYFDETIKQTLDSTILNNLNVHINYLFLILNSPSNELIKHLYSTVMDRRAILVLHYHSTFDNEPLLLCSGNRTTFELIEKILSKYLCPKIKYIEAQNETDEEIYSAYCISSIVQSASILHHFVNEQIQEILNENFNEEFQRKNEHVMNELFSQLSINKSTNQDNLGNMIENSNTEIVTNSNKQSAILNDLFDNGAIRTRIPPPICEYYLQEYLQKK